MSTLRELIDAQTKLANSVFEQAAANNRLAAVLERHVAPLEQLRHDVFDVKADRENDVRMYYQSMEGVRQQLTLLAERIQRMPDDISGVFETAQREGNDRTVFERMFAKLEKSPTSTKLWILVFVVVLIVSGWGRHLFE